MIALLLLLAFGHFRADNPKYFTLISTDCKVTGPVKDGKELSTWQGTAWIATCTVKDGKLFVAGLEADSKKPLGNETCEYFEIEDIGFATSEGGSIQYVFFFAEKYFSYGQVNTIVEKGIVITKTCIGRIEFKK